MLFSRFLLETIANATQRMVKSTVMQRHARFLPSPLNTQISICQRGGSRCLSIRITNYWRLATGALASRREITSLLSSPIKPSFPSPYLSPRRTHTRPSWAKHDGRPSLVTSALLLLLPSSPVSFAPLLSLHPCVPRVHAGISTGPSGVVLPSFQLVSRGDTHGRIRIWLIDPFRCNGLLCGHGPPPSPPSSLSKSRPAVLTERGERRRRVAGKGDDQSRRDDVVQRAFLFLRVVFLFYL